MKTIQAESVPYGGWPNCCRLTNGKVELIATTDVGPRIIRFALAGSDNELKEYPEQLGLTGGDQWRIYGGHRLWHAPEATPRTYAPDNQPVKLEHLVGGVRLIQSPEAHTGIQKEIEIRLDADQPHVQVLHRLRNTGLWAIELAAWALTVMAPGGTCIIPLPPRGTHPENLLPTSMLALWAYTDLADPRWTLGRRFILLRQDPAATTPQKIGAMVPDGWIAYARAGHLFVKRFVHVTGCNYPDFGCSAETFTNNEMLEVETLGPLVRLEPGAFVEHVEHWFLFDNVPVPRNDAEVEQHVLPAVKTTRVRW